VSRRRAARGGCLGDGLALRAGPFAPYVPLHREHAGHIVQLLGDVFADALHLAVATGRATGGGLGLVADLMARQVGRQRLAFGLLFGFGDRRRWLELFNLNGNGCQVVPTKEIVGTMERELMDRRPLRREYSEEFKAEVLAQTRQAQALLSAPVRSMTAKASAGSVNAMIESLFLKLKTERIWQRDYANFAEAMTNISDCIVGFYNSVLLHSVLRNLPLNVSEQQSVIKQPIV
jgi:putative transposase